MATLTVSLPDDTYLAALEAEFAAAGVEFILWDMQAPAPRESIDLVVPPYLDSAAVLAQLQGVTTQLVQWQSIGYDGVAEHLPAGVPFANAATVHETATAELAVGLIIAAQRELPRFLQQQQQGIWHGGTTRAVADRRVTIVGAGGVGKGIANRLAAFEVQQTFVASTARTETLRDGTSIRVAALAELDQLLPDTDILVLAVPLTPATTGLIGARELALLPDDALVVNVARGKVVDTAALVAELQARRLRSASDVVDPEPLPTAHPLWAAPGAIQTPHTGGDSDAMHPRMRKLIARQIQNLLAGQTPENLVSP